MAVAMERERLSAERVKISIPAGSRESLRLPWADPESGATLSQLCSLEWSVVVLEDLTVDIEVSAHLRPREAGAAPGVMLLQEVSRGKQFRGSLEPSEDKRIAATETAEGPAIVEAVVFELSNAFSWMTAKEVELVALRNGPLGPPRAGVPALRLLRPLSPIRKAPGVIAALEPPTEGVQDAELADGEGPEEPSCPEGAESFRVPDLLVPGKVEGGLTSDQQVARFAAHLDAWMAEAQARLPQHSADNERAWLEELSEKLSSLRGLCQRGPFVDSAPEQADTAQDAEVAQGEGGEAEPPAEAPEPPADEREAPGAELEEAEAPGGEEAPEAPEASEENAELARRLLGSQFEAMDRASEEMEAEDRRRRRAGLEDSSDDDAEQAVPAAAPRGLGPRFRPFLDWFQLLVGFKERGEASVRENLYLEDGRLVSRANGRSYHVGAFSTPSLGELRRQVQEVLDDPEGSEFAANAGLVGAPTFENVFGDTADYHQRIENRLATFQVASQFNCLEFTSPRSTPEKGISRYVEDRTQGPCCALACGAGAIYRNYFVPVCDDDGNVVREGQSSDHQIECLRGLQSVLDAEQPNRYFEVRAGHALAGDGGLRALGARLEELEETGRDALRSRLRVGLQEGVQVTSHSWGQERVADDEQLVTQLFGSACSVSHSGNSPDLWEPFARLVLEASFEATLWAAALCALRRQGAAGSRRVFLTALGGGAFGNSLPWIGDALQRAIQRVCIDNRIALHIFLITYASPPHMCFQSLDRRLGTTPVDEADSKDRDRDYV